MRIPILIAEDHQIVRDGLRALLEKEPDLLVVGEASDGRTAVRLAQELRPYVVIMDAMMPELNGVDATRCITEADPKCKVVALSMHNDRRYVLGMLRAGACAYVLKDAAFEELVQAIRTVLEDGTYLSPETTSLVVDDLVHRGEAVSRPELTRREREVLQLIAEGKGTKEIATRLSVSVKTVETHRKNIMARLGVRSVAELTKYAIREGLTSLE